MKSIVDEAKLYRGNEIKITDKISINQPTLGDIIDYGEDEYLNFVHLFTVHHLDYSIILLLDQMKIDINSVSDWDVFVMLCASLGDISKLFFGDLDFKSFEIYMTDNEMSVLKNKDDVVIDETLYKILVEYMRKMNNIPPPKFKRVSDDPIQKQMAIDDAKREIENAKRRSKFIEQGSQLLPVISSVVNHSGFKHDETTVFNMKIYAFWDSVKRLQVIDNAKNLNQGLYSGCLDLKKNPSLKKEMDWMRKI